MLGKALVLTISDTASVGKREDLSGPEARRILTQAGFEVAGIEILPDERPQIESRLRRASEEGFLLCGKRSDLQLIAFRVYLVSEELESLQDTLAL